MKVWCVFFMNENGCLILREIFHSQDKAVQFAVSYPGDDSVEYFVEAKWVH